MEIERRKLELDLMHCSNNMDQMIQVYNKAKKDAETISESYFKEVQRGSEKANLIKWNKVVKEKLNIDNMLIFGLFEE